MNPIVDLSPTQVESLPRGVHPCREYRVFDHERDQWVLYREFLYETAHGKAHIVLAPGRNLQQGMTAADRLLKGSSANTLLELGVYGIVNSVRNHEDLCSGSPLALVVARSGAHTEWSSERMFEILTGTGQTRAARLHRSMVNRPALMFPYQPFAQRGYLRIKPGYVPPEVKLKYAAPVGCASNELFPAGKIANRWSDSFYQSVLTNVDYNLWITEDEESAMCLSLLPMLLGLKMDVIGVPGNWARGSKRGLDIGKLATELEAYRFMTAEGTRRRVGIVFPQNSWLDAESVDALQCLCKTLREAGALVFVAVVLSEARQKNIGDFFAKHCVEGNVFNFTPILDLLNRSVHVDQDYEINFPTPDVSCRLKSLGERAEAFCEVQEKLRDKRFTELPSGIVDQVVLELGRLATDEEDANSYLEQFRAFSLEDQAARWADWMVQNPFQTKLDRKLESFIPPPFRDRGSIAARFCFEAAANNRLPLETSRQAGDGLSK
jgi:hypothetical protein